MSEITEEEQTMNANAGQIASPEKQNIYLSEIDELCDGVGLLEDYIGEIENKVSMLLLSSLTTDEKVAASPDPLASSPTVLSAATARLRSRIDSLGRAILSLKERIVV